jgi:PIN domain nuclease of toxin-antitoxin system
VPHQLGGEPLLVDASFVVAVLDREPLATRFTAALARTSIVDVNLGEVFYKVAEKMGIAPADVGAALHANGVRVIATGTAGAARFPMLKKRDLDVRAQLHQQGWSPGDIKSLSLADIACLATALERELVVLTGDKHWKLLGLPLRIEDFRDTDLVP